MTDPQIKAITLLRAGWRQRYGINWTDQYDARADETLIIILKTRAVDHVYTLCPNGLLKSKRTLIKES